MNKFFITLLFATFFIAINLIGQKSPTPEAKSIKWYTWSEAIELQKKQPKKLFIDVYTDWCGYCKKMDASTFVDPEIVDYMNANFYAVKLDAEQEGDIVWNNYTYKFMPGGRKGSHELAIAILNGQMSYPSFAYFDESAKRIRTSPGYKVPDQLMKELKYAKEEIYKKMNIDSYMYSN